MKRYSLRQKQKVLEHITKYFGKPRKLFPNSYRQAGYIDYYVIDPTEQRNFYTIVSVGAGARYFLEGRDGQNRFRSEIMMMLPAHWDITSKEPQWVWPLQLFRWMALRPAQRDIALSLAYVVRAREPFARNTLWQGATLYPISFARDGAIEAKRMDVCAFSDTDKVYFYHLTPLYPEELAATENEYWYVLARKLLRYGFVWDITRPNLYAKDQKDEPVRVYDVFTYHSDKLIEKELPVPVESAANHLAIYFRWLLEHDMVLDRVRLRWRDRPISLESVRSFVIERCHGFLDSTHLTPLGKAFTDYYYGSKVREFFPYFPRDVDYYALHYFGQKRYFSDEFQDEAYLFVPFDERYYQGLARCIQRHYVAWEHMVHDVGQGENHKSSLVQLLQEYVDCPSRYFSPVCDLDLVMTAYRYAWYDGKKEGFIPVLIPDESKWIQELLENYLIKERNGKVCLDRKRLRVDRKRTLEKGKIMQTTDKDLAITTHAKEWFAVARTLEKTRDHSCWDAIWDEKTGKTKAFLLVKLPIAKPRQALAWFPGIGQKLGNARLEKRATLRKELGVNATLAYVSSQGLIGWKQPSQ